MGENMVGAERIEAMGGLAKGLAILECFSAETPRLTLAEAARRTGLSRAAARRCLITLLEFGYVAQDGRDFMPQPRLLRLGYAFLSSTPLAKLALPVLEATQASLDEAVSLAILDGNEVVFIARSAPRRMVSLGPGVGSRLPSWCSATGRVLLAGLVEGEATKRLKGLAFEPLTARTVKGRIAVMKSIATASRDGFAISDEELELGLRSLAVPVRTTSGTVTAALSVSTQPARTNLRELRGKVLPVMIQAASRLSPQA